MTVKQETSNSISRTGAFYDFGTNEHGDVIYFVSYVLGISQKEAVLRLAESYHISPENPRKGMEVNELSDWEYEKIGIAGDRATKNFDFQSDRMPIERIAEISDKYAVPMSELRKTHPKTYERILRQRALPYVKAQRNDYYLDAWQKHVILSEYGYPEMFYTESVLSEFREQIKRLERVESIFLRVIAGTSLTYEPGTDYDPAKDLDRLSEGKLKPAL